MFDEKKVRDVWGQKSVVGQHQQFQFGGKSYDWGFLLLTTSDYLPSEAIPTSHDIILFQKLSLIPSEVFLRSIQMLAARRLKLGDPVKLVGGQSRGVIGVIEQIINDEAIIRIGYVTETVPVDDLRKHVEVGDEVLIVDGPHAGVQGWVVSTVEDSLVVYDHEALKEVVVRSDCVKFFEAPFIAVDLRPRVGDDVAVVGGPHRGAKGRVLSVTQHTLVLDNDKQGTAVEVDIAFVNLLDTPPATASRPPLPRTTRTRFGRDPNYRFIGNHVKVIKDGRFRGYKGIIKSTEDKDYVVVEIRATMQKEHIHLSSLALWNDPNMVPLNMKPSDTMNLAASTSTSSWTEIPETIMTTFEIPESRSLLVPSTPLPAGSSVSFSPPWNPSSRTPNATSAFPHNPWMESPSCAGIQVRVRIGGTKADLRDPGWKGGDYEDQPGLWNGTEGSMAKIIAGRRKTLLVPEKYVRPLRPSMQGQVVVSLEGPPIGEKWVVVKSDAENTRVGRRNKKGRIEEDSKQFLATKSLAVVVQ
ncbi:hypothetical protein FPV67DRAFT_1469559 [Lyophyllum atratum]|nr:hypothetical protein FPV67DRAFT_1469559 [Lyophyllum atratum]